jgi:hypothetical protein
VPETRSFSAKGWEMWRSVREKSWWKGVNVLEIRRARIRRVRVM